jgi:hypothetical protein
MAQAARRLTDVVDGFLARHRILVCDRDRKWSDGFRRIVEGAGVRIVLTPVQAPNANAHPERFVRSIRAGCLDRLILFGERRCTTPSTSSWHTTTGSETIRGSATSCLRPSSVLARAPTFIAARGWAGS